MTRSTHHQRSAAGPNTGGVRSTTLRVELVVALMTLALGVWPGKFLSGTPLRVREAMRNELLNRADYERMERGYYEALLDTSRRLGSMGEGPSTTARPGQGRPAEAPFEAGPLAMPVDDLREVVLKPSLSVRHRGAQWTTNVLGMRDRAYEMTKPPGTFRIALTGDSIAAGWGVEDGDGFEPRWERVLDERSKASGGPTVEVLNFAVPGHSPGARWEHFHRIGWTMSPDLVVFEATEADLGWDERRLRGLLARGLGWDSRLYREALRAAGARPGGTAESYKRALRASRAAILDGVYRTVVADCRARGVLCVWVLLPRVGKPTDPANHAHLIALARSAGFTATADISDAYDGLEPERLAVMPGDYHPNAEGHARLARRLDEALGALPKLRALRGGGPR